MIREEVELRSFISKNQYQRLLIFFKANSKFISKENQITYYFDGNKDLRIQKSENSAKIWLKKGKIHDESRKELEVPIDPINFETTLQIFLNIGLKIKIKWIRKRYEFLWKSIKVCLDFSKGYGYILELEKISNNKEQTIELLKKKFKELQIELTPREVFEEKYKYYQEHWRTLIK